MPDDRDRNQQQQQQQQGSGDRDDAAQGQRSSSGAPEHSLSEREYKDSKGNEHHHTNTYIEQHGGDQR